MRSFIAKTVLCNLSPPGTQGLEGWGNKKMHKNVDCTMQYSVRCTVKSLKWSTTLYK